MKPLYAFVLLSCLTLEVAALKVKGTITSGGEVKEVTFIVRKGLLADRINVEQLQQKVKYLDEAGVKQVARPENINAIYFELRGHEYSMVSVMLGRRAIFLQKVSVGDWIDVFKHHYSVPMSTGPGSVVMIPHVDTVLQKKGEDGWKPIGMRKRPLIIEYFKDCPHLVALIESKDFKPADLEHMADFYNDRCK
ncbi:MAG: hypothetical protein JXQ90_13630 [Cyclobacteriaceae bacterium]